MPLSLSPLYLLSGTTPFFRARLFSGTALFPLPGTAFIFPISSSFSSTLPLLPSICSLPVPPSFPAPALFGPQRLPSFGHIWPNGGPWLNKSPPFGQIGSNRGRPFSLIWSNGAEREGTLGAEEGGPLQESRGGALGESRC